MGCTKIAIVFTTDFLVHSYLYMKVCVHQNNVKTVLFLKVALTNYFDYGWPRGNLQMAVARIVLVKEGC